MKTPHSLPWREEEEENLVKEKAKVVKLKGKKRKVVCVREKREKDSNLICSMDRGTRGCDELAMVQSETPLPDQVMHEAMYSLFYFSFTFR